MRWDIFIQSCVYYTWIILQYRRYVLDTASIRTSVLQWCNTETMLLHNSIATNNLVGRFHVDVKVNIY